MSRMASGFRMVLGFVVLLVASPAVAQNDATVQKGNDTYQYWCATCHGSGPGHPGTAALEAKYKGTRPALLEERTDLSPQTIGFAVRQGMSIMPFFRKTEVTDADLDAIVRYLTRQRPSDPGAAGAPR